MKPAWIIAKRDFRSYFTSPIAYTLIGLFLFINGYMFLNFISMLQMQLMRFQGMGGAMGQTPTITDGIVRPLFGNMNVLLLLMIPLVTMRLFAEERKLQTIQLLMTAPVSLWNMILGKFLAALMLVSVMIGSTSIFIVVLAQSANPDFGPILTSYLGTFLMASCTLALGVFFSACTENQIVAAALTWVIGLFAWLISWSAQSAGPVLADVLNHLSLIYHFQNFGQGILSTVDLVYYASFIYFILFLTHRVLDSQRWR